MLNAEEREISIYKTDDEDEFTVYTTSPTWMRRIEKQGYVAYAQDTMMVSYVLSAIKYHRSF